MERRNPVVLAQESGEDLAALVSQRVESDPHEAVMLGELLVQIRDQKREAADLYQGFRLMEDTLTKLINYNAVEDRDHIQCVPHSQRVNAFLENVISFLRGNRRAHEIAA